MCYRLFAEKMTWQDARESCNAWGGDLVSISSESDNLYINELVRGEAAWIGLRYSYARDSWQWVDQSLPFVSRRSGYTAFSQTDMPDETGREECISLSDFGVTWISNRCSANLSSICSKAVPTPSSQAFIDISRRCSCCQKAVGGTKILSVKGIANFDSLYTFAEASGPTKYRLIFQAIAQGLETRSLTDFGVYATSQAFEVYPRAVALVTMRQPSDSTAEQPFPTQPIITIIDAYGNRVFSDGLNVSAILETS